MRLHVLNHHYWPDGSPSAILEEELADRLREFGFDTILVAGSGRFRGSARPAPMSPIMRLASGETGSRRSQLHVLADYVRFWRAARDYMRYRVADGDAVLATSSPFVNAFLIRTLRRSGRHIPTVFHLHDYLPGSLRSMGLVHRMAAPIATWLTDWALGQWGLVILCAGNLGYRGPNGVVARFWPTIRKPAGRTVATGVKKALYAGNLGIAHDASALAAEMTRLHDNGYDIDFYGDGPKADELPAFVNRHGFSSEDEFIDVLYSHPVHLVAGTPGDGTGSFPSKAINSLYIGADVRPVGYPPALLAEFEALKAISDLMGNLDHAARVVADYIQPGWEA